MRVKIFVGSTQPTYRFGIPIDSNLSELSEMVQNAVRALGELRFIEEITLEPIDSFWKARLKQIKDDGATLWKQEIRFEEISH